MAFEGLGTIGQIHVSVTDVERSVTFYRDVLGMRFLFDVPGQPMAFFDCGGVRLYLGKPESPEFRSNPILYFTVPDLSEGYAALRERGVEFRDEPHLVAKMGDDRALDGLLHGSRRQPPRPHAGATRDRVVRTGLVPNAGKVFGCPRPPRSASSERRAIPIAPSRRSSGRTCSRSSAATSRCSPRSSGSTSRSCRRSSEASSPATT